MKKAPLYSRSRQRPGSNVRPEAAALARDASIATSSPDTSPPSSTADAAAPAEHSLPPTRRQRIRHFFARHRIAPHIGGPVALEHRVSAEQRIEQRGLARRRDHTQRARQEGANDSIHVRSPGGFY
jgi:hypothetical protein